MAAPNTRVIAEARRGQIGALFDLAELGPQALAGFEEPQPAWRVIGESGMLSRFEALRSGTTPLVGRDEELELLIRRWEQAKSGEGRVVLAVVMELQRSKGTKVKLTLEIEADAEDGFSEADIGVVRDNARQLRFKPESTDFE